jgi:hypothetical protein
MPRSSRYNPYNSKYSKDYKELQGADFIVACIVVILVLGLLAVIIFLPNGFELSIVEFLSNSFYPESLK